MTTQTDRAIEALRMTVRQNEHDMLMTGDELRECCAALAAVDAQPAEPAQEPPPGFVLVPLRMTRAMELVVEAEDWQWADLLAAAESVTLEQYQEAGQPAEPVQEPVGEVVIGESGFTKGWTVVQWREDLPPIATGTKLYTAPQATQPLTDEQIAALVLQTVYEGDASTPHRDAWATEIGIPFARAIERAHGIGVAA